MYIPNSNSNNTITFSEDNEIAFYTEIFDEVKNIKENESEYIKKFIFSAGEESLRNRYRLMAEKFSRVGSIKFIDLVEQDEDESGNVKSISFRIHLIPKKFIEFYNRKFNLTNTQQSKITVKTFITRDDDGTFFFDEKPLYIKNTSFQYFRIFEVAFSLMPNGGEIEYQAICTAYKRRYAKAIKKEKVLRALSGSSARLFSAIPDLPAFTSDNTPLFQTTGNGRTIKFNNSKH